MNDVTGEIRWCPGCRQDLPAAEFQKGTQRWCWKCMQLQHLRRRAIDYDAELGRQGGGCAICAKPPARRRLNVDHDHRTGKFRGLLCDGCNAVLGKVDDSVDLLNAAISYLEKPGRTLALGESKGRRRRHPSFPVTVSYQEPRTPEPRLVPTAAFRV